MNGITLTAAQLDALRAISSGAAWNAIDSRTRDALKRKGCVDKRQLTLLGKAMLERADLRAEQRLGEVRS